MPGTLVAVDSTKRSIEIALAGPRLPDLPMTLEISGLPDAVVKAVWATIANATGPDDLLVTVGMK